MFNYLQIWEDLATVKYTRSLVGLGGYRCSFSRKRNDVVDVYFFVTLAVAHKTSACLKPFCLSKNQYDPMNGVSETIYPKLLFPWFGLFLPFTRSTIYGVNHLRVFMPCGLDYLKSLDLCFKFPRSFGTVLAFQLSPFEIDLTSTLLHIELTSKQKGN